MSKLARRVVFGVGATLLAAATAFQFQRRFTSGPRFEVLRRVEGLEVRRYAPRVVARTRLAGLDAESKNQGFRLLAGYIFGGNEGSRRIAMTTPVTTEPETTRIAMTTPVETVVDEGASYMTFTMPSEWALGDLPRPKDSRVELLEVPGQRVAVLRFAGRPTPAEFEAKQAQLVGLLLAAGLRATGPAYSAQYDPPWVLPFLRRNEVLVPVDDLATSGVR